MRHQTCLRNASKSPQLVNCTKGLAESFNVIFNEISETTAHKEDKILRACQFVYTLMQSAVHVFVGRIWRIFKKKLIFMKRFMNLMLKLDYRKHC